jgi:hypothetical protein
MKANKPEPGAPADRPHDEGDGSSTPIPREPLAELDRYRHLSALGAETHSCAGEERFQARTLRQGVSEHATRLQTQRGLPDTLGSQTRTLQQPLLAKWTVSRDSCLNCVCLATALLSKRKAAALSADTRCQ